MGGLSTVSAMWFRNIMCLVLSCIVLASVVSASDIPLACRLKDHVRTVSVDQDGSAQAEHQYSHVISVGDVHGSLDGLLEVLYHANVTSARGVCEWNPLSENTLVVQLGDIVDRGEQALEAWLCMDKLQTENVPAGSRVVRLAGNHELWWLEGRFHHRNPQFE
jgi:hypothetical protein